MRLVLVLIALFCVSACRDYVPHDPQKELASAQSESDRFYALGEAAKASFESGEIEAARVQAKELEGLTEKFRGDWNYGNAIQDANVVLGRIALKEARIDEAKARLMKAGNSPGSPQMNTFGPNVSLARDLLIAGEREVVLEYFRLCRNFWEDGKEELDLWERQIKQGKVPDFGANLIY